MLNEDDYNVLKSSLIDSQRLFDKLNSVSNKANELDYDESGLYSDEEEILERHWLKLSSKIIDALGKSLEAYKIELLKNKSLETRKLSINLVKENEVSKIIVDYSEDASLSISQIS
ncbi:hypothetical protein [Sulfurimonas sp.]|uniref:hypothetical protein n=1 Tax=Sulfurimonas sp. TaxID=2022749 RepID=UPI0025D77818|nr:hypothetical protein [Sulfurimonas sp.]